MHIAQFDEPKLHVVVYFDDMLDDFRLIGIFTLRQDAELMLLDTKGKKKGASRLELSLTAVKEFLVKERFNELAPAIEKTMKEIEAA